MSERLSLSQASRRERAQVALDRRIESMLDAVGLDQKTCLAAGPDARAKLKGILDRLAKQRHPFSQCMRDLAKHRPELSEPSRKRICGRLKSMVEGSGRAKAFSDELSDDSCPLVDVEVFALLEKVDDAALDSFVSGSNRKGP